MSVEEKKALLVAPAHTWTAYIFSALIFKKMLFSTFLGDKIFTVATKLKVLARTMWKAKLHICKPIYSRSFTDRFMTTKRHK